MGNSAAWVLNGDARDRAGLGEDGTPPAPRDSGGHHRSSPRINGHHTGSHLTSEWVRKGGDEEEKLEIVEFDLDPDPGLPLDTTGSGGEVGDSTQGSKRRVGQERKGDGGASGAPSPNVVYLPNNTRFAVDWAFTKSALQRHTVDTVAELQQVMTDIRWSLAQRHSSPERIHSDAISALSAGEKTRFFRAAWPRIKNAVLVNLEKEFPDGCIELLSSDSFSRRVASSGEFTDATDLILTRSQVYTLNACAFLCLFSPSHVTGSRNTVGAVRHPRFTFADVLMQATKPGVMQEKLRCILYYLSVPVLSDGNVTFRRLRSKLSLVEFDAHVTARSPTTPLVLVRIRNDTRIEDTTSAHLQVDFANKYVGGGALTEGCVQEEIRFMINPECLVSMLVVEPLDTNEALHIIGVHRYSDYTGYGHTFACTPIPPIPSFPTRDNATTIVAMDALPFNANDATPLPMTWSELHHGHSYCHQFTPRLMVRELAKAVTGFDARRLETGISSVASGRWGCGEFNGSVLLKVLLQWIAATLAGHTELKLCMLRPTATFGAGAPDSGADNAAKLIAVFFNRKITAELLWMKLKQFCREHLGRHGDLDERLYQFCRNLRMEDLSNIRVSNNRIPDA